MVMDVPSDSFYCNVDEIVGTFPTTVAIEILWAAQEAMLRGSLQQRKL